MAKPNILQKLRGGKILCGNVFPFFVETWNWLVGSYDNLRGDFDTNAKNGAITVDKTDPDHPVIRLRTDNLKLGGGKTYVCGENSNIIFTEQTSGDVAIDVYYV